jgi:type II secretory ATPase GspE/PulE/Tfp pilus assembly ATPase PilB-like protein
VRKLCFVCRKEVALPTSSAGEFGGNVPPTVWDAVGCDACSGTGYLGRLGIFEWLQATPEMCKLIIQHADANSIRTLAISQGMRLLRDDGWQKVRDGVTTLGEVLRVTREEL